MSGPKQDNKTNAALPQLRLPNSPSKEWQGLDPSEVPLPKQELPRARSASPAETRAQLQRLASGLQSQLRIEPQQSGLAAALQLETRLLGGLVLEKSTSTASGHSQFERAAGILKSIKK